jgi:hypothetical protein
MGRATHPSGSYSSERSVLWLELLSSPPSSGSPPTATPVVGTPSGGAGEPAAGAQGSRSSQTLSPAEVRKKSPAAPAPVANAPAFVQAVVQPLQMARLTSHWTAKRTLHETRRQERND